MGYPSNSHKSKEENRSLARTEEKRVEKVVKGAVKTKKKGGVSKLADIFINEDVSNVKSYILMDVLIPATKKAISDIITNGIDMILYGGNGRGGRPSGGRSSYVNYSSYSRDERPRDSRHNTRFDYDDIIFQTRGEAIEVRDQMEDLIAHFGHVTVADLYDMADLTAPYTANKYGWMNVRNVEPVRVRDGYILKLPRAVLID